MPPEELTLILKLRDEATAQLKSVKGTVTAVGTAMVATGLKVGAEWAKSTKTIVDGTGATGPALKRLQTDFQAVAKHGAARAATAIADLNTHLGLTGPELQSVADRALKAEINTSKFGAVAEQTGRDVDGYRSLLDDLTVAGQATGVSTDQLLDTVSKNSARWQAGGGDIEDLISHVVSLANEFGPSGLRGAMSETMAEVDTGVIPTVQSLAVQLGDTTGAVERTFEASRTWRDVLGEVKNAAIAYAGPAGDMLAGIGGLSVGLVQVIPLIKGTAIAQRVLNLAMKLNPVGLVIAAITLAGVAIWTFRDQIMGFLKGAWNKFVGAIESAINFLRPLGDFIGIELPDDLGSWKIAQEEATAAVEAAEPAVVELETSTAALAATVAVEAVPAIEAFDLSTVNLKTQLQQVKPEIKDIGGLLEASGVQAGAAVLPWGFFADEVSVKVPNAMDIAMDSIMEVPPTAEEVARQLRVIAPTWGQEMLDGLKSTWSPVNVGGTLAAAFEGGGDYRGAVSSLGAQSGTWLGEGLSERLGGMTEGLGGKLGGLIGGALGVAMPIVGPLLGKAAEWITDKLFGLFDKPSAAVVAARQTMADYALTIESDSVNQERLKDWISSGFTEAHAVIVTSLQDLALAAGETSQVGVDLWLKYQTAVEEGNQAGIDAVMGQIEAWREQISVTDEAAIAAEEAAAIAVAASEEAAAAAVAATEEQKRALDDWQRSLVGGYLEMVETADDAYREVATTAILSGASIQKAEAAGFAAWQASYEEQKALRIRQMAEEEAFSAALLAVQSGHADQASEAALAAYQQTVEAAELAYAAIEEADARMHAGLGDSREAMVADSINAQQIILAAEIKKAAAMKASSTDVANHTISESARAASGAIASMDAVAAAAARAASASRAAASAASSGGGGSRGGSVSGGFSGTSKGRVGQHGGSPATEAQMLEQGWTLEKSNVQWNGKTHNLYSKGGSTRYVIPDWAYGGNPAADKSKGQWGFYDDYKGQTVAGGVVDAAWWFAKTGLTVPKGMAKGGPVMPGQGYMVGERGPEFFSPMTPGHITPNDGGKANARMIGLEVAKALRESPISIPQDAVTDSVLRAAPGREALRGWA